MPRNENPVVKEETLGHVVKVQQVMDFIVLAELQKGRRYGKQIDDYIVEVLNGVGVNDSYLAQRLKTLAEKGHVIGKWDSDNRYNRFYEITDSGIEYFNQLLRELPERVELAQKVYRMFNKFMNKYD
ncbi:PadR family transcriptional regulator [Paenibacillus solisilvae]|uniref:PadR family transcriptional regulator n=1 Tax=Paenibacillus solisilvae TaxID=2486751 RepID=A0ABW0VZW5_9BACL